MFTRSELLMFRKVQKERDVLEARLADMTAEADSWRANARDSGEEARKYKARLAEAERDAERYRYLFRHDDSPVARINAIYQMWDGEDGCAGFEAVIDAIMERK